MSSTTDGVLRALIEAGGESLSGEKLAELLGVSRAAVWKSVKALEAEGYEISGQRGRGYSILSGPEVLRAGAISARLTTSLMGCEVRHFQEVDSTNRQCSRWGEEGAPEGALVVADHQLSGRGRLGRSWHDDLGESLMMSLLLRPKVELSRAPLLTFVAAVALAETLANWVDEKRLEIKWPNDLLIGGRKISGILLESRIEATRLDFVVLGMGVNVRGSTDNFPDEIKASATTLEAEGGEGVSRLELLAGFLERFEELYLSFCNEGFGPIKERWDRWFKMVGEEVRVTGGGNVITGVVRELSGAGALILENEGELLPVHAGELSRLTTRL
ncbi:MAG: biotin--[acetyl-CoA-carboxylase] ligase [Deltaproteobacteria bacterium]|nr:MAG: biotin--[acetyl-CoA-carboxylase] ligase [Deltaproteobacteria bacterium]